MSAVTARMHQLEQWWVEGAPRERLATLRILTGLFALVYVAVRLAHFADYSMLSAAEFQPVGVVSMLDAPLPRVVTWALAFATCASGLPFVLGWRFRVTGPLFAALFWWITSYRCSWGMIFHNDNLLALHLVVLALAPAADAYGLGAPPGSRSRTDAPALSTLYGWPIRLMCMLTALTYLVSAVAKLRASGLEWVTTDVLRDYVAYDAIRKIELGSVHSPLTAWMVTHPLAFRVLAGVTLCVELSGAVAVAWRRAAPYWVGAMIMFHLGITAIMAILFPYPTLGFAFASFFAVERLAEKVRQRWMNVPTTAGAGSKAV